MQMVTNVNKKKRIETKTLIKISLMGALSFLLFQLRFPIPIFPTFLDFDVAEVPAIIAGFSMGPIAGIAVVFIKNLLDLPKTSTMGVGQLSNFIIGSSYVVTASLIYKYNKTKKGALLGLLAGTVVMVIMGIVSNNFIIIPFYAKVIGVPLHVIVNMGTVANKYIVDMRTLIILGITPFNILKGTSISIVTLLIYKHVSRLLNR